MTKRRPQPTKNPKPSRSEPEDKPWTPAGDDYIPPHGGNDGMRS